MTDTFSQLQPGLDSPATRFAAITPSDSTDLAVLPRGIYTGAGGAIAVKDADGTTTTFSSVPAGAVLPIRPARVMATDTTATGLVALY